MWYVNVGLAGEQTPPDTHVPQNLMTVFHSILLFVRQVSMEYSFTSSLWVEALD